MNLLSINPEPFDVAAKMREVTSFFEMFVAQPFLRVNADKDVRSECQQKQIALSFCPGNSLVDLEIAYILADANRLAQILINFLSNAVKCTQDAPSRKIAVHLEVYASTPPPISPSALRVPESFEPATSVTDPVWITVSVQDSGRGLSGDDMTKLFHRFAQANPKTDQYGGSVSLFEPRIISCFSLILLYRDWDCLSRSSSSRSTMDLSNSPQPPTREAVSCSPFQRNELSHHCPTYRRFHSLLRRSVHQEERNVAKQELLPYPLLSRTVLDRCVTFSSLRSVAPPLPGVRLLIRGRFRTTSSIRKSSKDSSSFNNSR